MEITQKTPAVQTPNARAMAYLQSQVDLYLTDKNSFFHGHVVGAAQALCMAGIITADQCREIEDRTW
jgi:hypothetical protein